MNLVSTLKREQDLLILCPKYGMGYRKGPEELLCVTMVTFELSNLPLSTIHTQSTIPLRN